MFGLGGCNKIIAWESVPAGLTNGFVYMHEEESAGSMLPNEIFCDSLGMLVM